MRYKSEKSVNILALNCGSSSLKYRIISMPTERQIVQGEAERVGMKTKESAAIYHSCLGKGREVKMDLPDHACAFRQVLELIKEDGRKNREIRFDIFAHRYVHPGAFFSKTTRINGPALKSLRNTLELAPIHNPNSFKLIELCNRDFPKIGQFAVFDNSFHASIPKEYSTYAIPARLAKKYGLRKVGFHGISYEYAMQEACKLLDVAPKTQRIIGCHLSSGGSSVCAIDCGRSINNSMGFTPLEGLVMNTRSGDLDPGLIFYIMFKEKFSADETEQILNKKSGILGIYSSSSDLRDVIKEISKDPKAGMAFNMYIKKVKKYVSYYNLLLRKADILLFTDSIGMKFPLVREKVCEGLEFYGIYLDKEKNQNYAGGVADISDSNSQTRIIVVPIDEELMMARAAYKEFTHDSNS